jgi:glycosyltransferase involved in cell wall biosynthesis
MLGLSIVIPSLNEAQNLPALISDLNVICLDNNIDAEIIVSDDASDDNTLSVAINLQASYPNLRLRILHRNSPRRGYGAVVRYGLAHATGRYAAIVAADGQNPIRLLPKMLNHALNGAHLVQCSRYSNPGDEKNIPFLFKLYQKVFRTLVKILLGRSLPDSTYGFKIFDRVLVLALGITSNRYNLSPEITFKMLLSGANVVFVRGKQEARQAGKNKFKLYRELDGYLYVLLRACLHRLGVLWF